MKVKKLLKKVVIGQYINIVDSSMSTWYSGLVRDVNINSEFLNKEVLSIWYEDFENALCIKYR